MHHILKTPKDWKGWYGDMPLDLPNRRVLQAARLLAEIQLPMVIVSARQDHCLIPTLQWLKTHDVPPHSDILMRDKRDNREDTDVKADLVRRMIEDMGYSPRLAFEDREHLVTMFEGMGIPTIHVGPAWYE
jgi:hypothetical protein